jgi:UDP:flavonoid glycosyltransferase YjiC (YdhE family)
MVIETMSPCPTAYFVQKSGVGEALDLRVATVEACADCLRRLLAPKSEYLRRAREVQLDFRRHDGAEGAAGAILDAAYNAKAAGAST